MSRKYHLPHNTGFYELFFFQITAWQRGVAGTSISPAKLIQVYFSNCTAQKKFFPGK